MEYQCFNPTHASVWNTAGDGDLRGREFDWLYRYGIIAFLTFHPLRQKTQYWFCLTSVYFYHQNFQIHCIANHILLTCSFHNVFTFMSRNPGFYLTSACSYFQNFQIHYIANHMLVVFQFLGTATLRSETFVLTY